MGKLLSWGMHSALHSAALSLTLLFSLFQGNSSKNAANGFQQNVNEIFTPTFRGEAQASDGTHLAFTKYKNASGTIVAVTYGSFTSPEAARKQLQLSVAPANTIVARTRKKDSSGHMVGERAVVHF